MPSNTDLSERPSGGSDEPSEQSEDTPAEDQPSEQSEDTPAEDQPAEQSEDTPAEDQPSEQSEDTPAEDQPAEQSDGASAAQSDEQLSAERQNMLDLINLWMPTSLLQPRIPNGQTQDLMGKAHWDKARGVQSKDEKDKGGHPVTSCGDILTAMLVLWKSNFVGAFGIRDEIYIVENGSRKKQPGAKARGFYVEADGVKVPKPGDIIVLRNGFGPGSVGSVGHVGILVEASATVWRTADGGGGALPDQTASVTDRTVRLEKNIPILKSPTDGKEKQLDGWIDLDRLEQTG